MDAEGGSTEEGSSTSGGDSSTSTGLPPDETTTGNEATSGTTTGGGGLDTSTGPGVLDTGSFETGSSGSSSTGGDETTTGADVEYDYLVAFAAVIAPQTPFQFVGAIEADDSTITMSLTPLSLDVGSVDTPREPVPPPIAFEGTVDVDGRFSIDVPEIELAGVTNPVTGSDIVAQMQIEGEFVGEVLCAQVTGMVTVPANIDLQGSTFSAMPLDLGPMPLPEDLPLPTAIDCP